MADQPTALIVEHVNAGDFFAASEVAREHGLPIHDELAKTAAFLSVTTWLASHGEPPQVREEAGRVLRAVAAISPRWVENARPHPPVPDLMPRDKPAFEALMIRALGDRGYYHPVDLPGGEGRVAPRRANAPDASGAYHRAEWALARPLLERACGGSLHGRVIVDAGCSDGFFSLALAGEGAQVIALDVAVTMALRTATFAALKGLGDRVVVQLGPAQDLRAILSRLRTPSGTPPEIDAICALGLIYHFDDLIPPLTALTRLAVPILFEIHACSVEEEAGFDPVRHRNPEPVSLPWLTGWLAEAGFAVIPEPGWRQRADVLATRPQRLRHEMLLALPTRSRDRS